MQVVVVVIYGDPSDNEIPEGTMISSIVIAYWDLDEVNRKNNNKLRICIWANSININGSQIVWK